MAEKMQADGQGGPKGESDGVGDAATHGKADGGASGGGESQGGAYPNPETGKEGKDAPSHGGQTKIDYHGPDNANATTKVD